MKVVIDYKQIRPNSKTGVPIVTNRIIQFLANKNVQCLLLTSNQIKNKVDLPLALDPFKDKIEILSTGYNYSALGSYRFFFEQFIFPFFAFKYKDLPFIFPDSYGLPFFLNMKRSFLIVHDVIPLYGADQSMSWWNKFIYKLSLLISLNKAKQIITVSEFTKKEILRFFSIPERKIKVIYNGINIRKIRKLFNSSTKDTIKKLLNKYGLSKGKYLFVGSGLAPRKKLFYIVKLFRYLSRYDSTLKLLILASKKKKKPILTRIENYIKENGLEKKVAFTGVIEDESKFLLIRNSLALIFFSSIEGFGLPIIEAFACKTPVICSNIPVFKEIAGKAAFYLDINKSPKDNEKILLEIIKTIQRGGDKVKEMTDRGLELAENRYNSERNLEKLWRLLNLQ